MLAVMIRAVMMMYDQLYYYMRNTVYPMMQDMYARDGEILDVLQSVLERVGQLVFIVGFFAALYFVCRFLGDLLFSY